MSLESMEYRKAIQKLIEQGGGEVTIGVALPLGIAYTPPSGEEGAMLTIGRLKELGEITVREVLDIKAALFDLAMSATEKPLDMAQQYVGRDWSFCIYILEETP